MVSEPPNLSQEQFKKQLLKLMDKVIEANKAYCDELDKPKRDRTARRLFAASSRQCF
jgi:hypothetical protein